MAATLFSKVWDAHTVRILPTGQTQLFVGLHLVHEVTSPQAFDMLRLRGLRVAFPERTVATVDHIVPTDSQARPFADPMAEEMIATLERNCAEFGIPLLALGSERQGIVHVIGPELGLTQPGMTIACGDSHTSTHGAFGAIAFGIGTTQVRDVLASQCLALDPLKVRRIDVDGALGSGRHRQGRHPRDHPRARRQRRRRLRLRVRRLGRRGDVDGRADDPLQHVDRGGRARGLRQPRRDDVRVPEGRVRSRRRATPGTRPSSGGVRSRPTPTPRTTTASASTRADIEPNVTWGINPGQSVPVSGRVPRPADVPDAERTSVAEALDYMGFSGGEPIAGTRIDVAFIGSCTNGRLSDLREAADVVRGRRVAPHVKALVVPGSVAVKAAAEREGLDEIFRDAGFEWRDAGCSMCLAMNPDQLEGRQVCASSSNRNFKGRQGSPTGRTLLMSPAMVAAAAVAGEVVDVRTALASGGRRTR